MVAIEIGELRKAVERLHGDGARLVRSVRISESFDGESVWEGMVHIFELKGHPTASRAYAWSSLIEGSSERQFFAVLSIPPITSPVEAVRATVIRKSPG
jgi:acetylornithine deacetylase/succinyl-diaminopimelate desuccinylase-like protein